jgi:anti-sigma factor ChrR (cupin superfamily)
MQIAPITTALRPDAPQPGINEQTTGQDEALLNMDFAKRVVVESARQHWTPSRSETVWRKPLEREAAESGRTSSIVRFGASSYFPEHAHPLGEEILVLSGEFRDEHGRYPAGTWIRSPHLSQHHPFVDAPTLIWVKVGHLPG